MTITTIIVIVVIVLWVLSDYLLDILGFALQLAFYVGIIYGIVRLVKYFWFM